MIIAIAAYCDRRTEEGLAWKDVFKLLVMAGIPIVLILKQPDLGTAIIMLIVLLIMLAVAGLPAADPRHVAARAWRWQRWWRPRPGSCTPIRSPG